jgi:hypothetical protein
MNQFCRLNKLPGFKQGANVGPSSNDTRIGDNIRARTRSGPFPQREMYSLYY